MICDFYECHIYVRREIIFYGPTEGTYCINHYLDEVYYIVFVIKNQVAKQGLYSRDIKYHILWQETVGKLALYRSK